jgi:hypothetical protein
MANASGSDNAVSPGKSLGAGAFGIFLRFSTSQLAGYWLFRSTPRILAFQA